MTATLVPPPPRNTLVESLARQISALIRREGLRPGERLPSVRALAAQLGVAVPTLREGLRRLEAQGVVEIRHGAGIFVRATQPRVMIANPGLGGIDAQTVLDLLDTRLLIEPHLAELAAQAGDEAGVAALGALLDEAERHLNDDAVLQRANMAFHAGVARCSGNVVLTHVMESLIDLYAPEQAAILSPFHDARSRDHREHAAILAAIRAGDATEARASMRRHLLAVKELALARLPALAHARKVDWLAAGDWGRAHSEPGGAGGGGPGDAVGHYGPRPDAHGGDGVEGRGTERG